MSRPFSYNDENFTVIGNLLFVHIFLTKPYKSGEPLIEIPPAIFSRMITFANVAIESSRNFYGGGYIGFKVVKVDNKYYFALTQDTNKNSELRCYYCNYLLKDI